MRLAGTDLPLERLRSEPERHARLFEDAKTAPGHGLCLCREQPLPLVIRLRSGRYHLAGWPGHGAEHHAECLFFKLAEDMSGRSALNLGAIVEHEDGISIRLRNALLLVLDPQAPELSDTDHTPAVGRDATSLLGLLHVLWEQAGLNVWQRHTGDRTWKAAHRRLTDAAATCTLGTRPLADLLHIVPPYHPDTATHTNDQLTRFTSRLGRHLDRQHRGLILGEIKTLTPGATTTRLNLRHQRASITLPNPLIERAQRSYRPVFAPHRPRSRQIALLLVERTGRDRLHAVDMCAMLTNTALIPGESGPEILAADHLIARGRTFAKPLRFDTADAVFPDFVLTDTRPPAYMEVWGVHGRQDYEDRRRAKELHYRQSGATLVSWDTATDLLADLPLPPRHTDS
ncbi:DUF1173 family protein [Streptacidiphilus sp. EB129]|uniref:DUF1173 family protein n=1 Tax=Streptacidiphilus sp. EB129 TaxID=3156262 RepID=UPI00351911B2